MNIKHIQNNYLTYILKGLLLLTLLVPLVYSIGLWDGVVFTKTTFFTGLVELAFVIYLILVFRGKYKIRFTWLDWSLVGFLAILVLNTIFSQNSFISFWGMSSRSLSLFIWIHLFVFYLMVRGVFSKFSDIKILLRTVLIIGGLTAIYVFLQLFFDWKWLIPGLYSRITGPLGNPIFTGDLLALIAVLSWGVSWIAKKFSWRFWYIVIFLISVVALSLLQARGSILAFIIGWLFITLGLMWQGSDKLIKHIGWLILILFITLSSLTWVYRDSNFIQSMPVINRFADLSLDSANVQNRFSTWAIATDAFIQKPILGYGLNNFKRAFNDNYMPIFEQFGTHATKFDKAHNFLFEYLSTTGILGLIGYLLIFVVTFWWLYRVWRKSKKNKKVLSLTFAGVLITYLVANLTSIEHLASLMVIMILIALVSNMYISNNQPERSLKNLSNWQLSTIVVITILVVYSGLQYHIKPIIANRNIAIANSLASQGKFNQSLILAESSISLDTFNRPDLILQFVSQTDENVAYRQDVTAANNYLISSVKMLENYTIPYYKNDVAVYTILGGVYSKLATVGEQSDYISNASSAFEKAVELSPSRALTWVEWGKVFLSTDYYAEAVNKFDIALELNNQFSEAHILNAISKLYLKNFDDAEVHLNWVLQNQPIILTAPVYAGLIVDAYVKDHRFIKAIEYLNVLLEIHPNLDEARGRLAALYKEIGRIIDARREAEYLLYHGSSQSIKKAAKEFLKTI